MAPVRRFACKWSALLRMLDIVTISASRFGRRFTPLTGPLTATGDQQPVGRGTFVVLTRADVDPLSLATSLRKEVTLVRPEIRVSNIRTQNEIVQSKTTRERLLSILAGFFAVLTAVGLYGVLDFSVLQQRRDIGIRIALGAQKWHIIQEVTSATLAVVALGAVLGYGREVCQ